MTANTNTVEAQRRPVPTTQYGWIGLGNMGRPMAVNLTTAGHRLMCFDAAGTAERLPAGAVAADSVADVAEQSEVIFVSVPDGAASIAVARSIANSPGPRSIVVDLSTIGPNDARTVGDLLAASGVRYCDGPVSGGAAGARAKTISLMFSGPADLFGRLQPVLACFAGNVFNIGTEVGQGQTMKLVNNVLSAAALAVTSEAFAFGQTMDLDLATMVDVVNASSGRNTATSDKFPNRVIPGTFDAGFATAHMTKDVNLYLAAAASQASPRQVGEAIARVWNAANASRPGSDFTEIWRHIAGT